MASIKFISAALLLYGLIGLIQCYGYNDADYKIYIGARPLMAFTTYSKPTEGLSISPQFERQSIPTSLCGAYVLESNKLLTSIRCYPSSTESVDMYIFSKNYIKPLLWNTKESKVLRDNTLLQVEYFHKYNTSIGHLITNAAVMHLDAPYFNTKLFDDLNIPYQDDAEYDY